MLQIIQRRPICPSILDMDWFARDFDDERYFEIYRSKEEEAAEEGPALAAYLDLPPGSRVLDLPCGWGRLRPFLAERGLRVIGGDLSPLNLARHQRECPGELVRLDLRALPFRDECADGVFCAFTSWGYFASDAENLQQLREFARVLKPGAILLLDLAGRQWLAEGIAGAGGAWRKVEGYRERVRWSPDGRRVLVDRIHRGERFRHDIWIPTDGEVRTSLTEAGFELTRRWGGLQGEAWTPAADRWIYRAVRRTASA